MNGQVMHLSRLRALVMMVLLLASCAVGPDPDAAADITADSEAPSAIAVLETLEVKGRAPKTGYDRSLFGYRNVDLDRNGCDTRNDILDRDLDAKTYRAGTAECVVLTGILMDPYTGKVMEFDREDSSAIQIDHVVALMDAWQKGAQSWDADKLTQFGNDPLNLLAVSGQQNSQKGASDAASWLPANKSFRCEYVARQIAVKHQYELWVTAAEYEAMAQVLATCPDQRLPEAEYNQSPPAAAHDPEPPTELQIPPAADSDLASDVSPPINQTECPDSHPVKGNQGTRGWIYHVEGQSSSYHQTHPEECFASPAAAERAGYRKPAAG